MTSAELVDRLQRLSTDEELPKSAREALYVASRAGLGPSTLEVIIREAYDVLAGMSTAPTLAGIVDDAIANERSLAV